MRLEPRIESLELRISDDAILRNALDVTIFFTMQNVSEAQDISFKVSRVR